MAGDSNTGGGGSVYWSVDVNKVDSDPSNTTCEGDDQGHYHQRGRDADGNYGDRFTISIKIPSVVDGDSSQRDEFLGLWQAPDTLTNPGRVTFTIPIEKDKKQINIKWGDTSGLPRHGNAVVKHPHALAKKSAGRATAKKRAVKKATAKKPAARKGKTRRSKGR